MSPRIATALLGAALWLLVGGAIGLALGVLVATIGPIALERLEPAADRRRREALEHAAADIAELLALCLGAGADLRRSVEVTLRSQEGVVADELARLARALDRGAGAQAWADLATRVPAWRGTARAVARCLDRGAPVAPVLLAQADREHARHRDRRLERARGLAVRTTIPLALLVLPGFVLLGVVPLVASLARALAPLP